MTKLSITQADIDLGVMGSPCDCPIARAARRAFPGHDVDVADVVQIHAADEDEPDVFYEINDDVRLFIRTFDDGGIVYPFDFELVECPNPGHLATSGYD